jgi:hypothetical protein
VRISYADHFFKQKEEMAHDIRFCLGDKSWLKSRIDLRCFQKGQNQLYGDEGHEILVKNTSWAANERSFEGQ